VRGRRGALWAEDLFNRLLAAIFDREYCRNFLFQEFPFSSPRDPRVAA
jgi:hypothetical protein